MPSERMVGPEGRTGVFRIAERDIRPGRRALEVTGELDLATSGQLETALDRAAEDQNHLLADLSGCDFIDVEGLALLQRTHQKLEERGGLQLLCGAHGQVERMLTITGSIEGELVLLQPEPDRSGRPRRVASLRLTSAEKQRRSIGC